MPPNYLTVQPDVMLAQIDANLSRDTGFFIGVEPHDGSALIVGGGPSLADTLPDLMEHINLGGILFALNGAHDWLIEHGLIPDYHVMCDARAENAEFVRESDRDVSYLIASQCHPDVFQALEGHDVIQWIAWVKGVEEVIARHPDKPLVAVGGGNTVGLKAIALAHLWGFADIHLYGFDSSGGHAYAQPLNDAEELREVIFDGRSFHCARWQAKQVDDFRMQAAQLRKLGVTITAHGDGLLPWMQRQTENV